MSMIFSALRKFEDSFEGSTLNCLDDDLEAALKLIEIYVQHTVVIYRFLPKQRKTNLSANKEKFIQSLPEYFQRHEAIDLGKTLSMSVRTVDKILFDFQDILFVKDDFGKYRKIKVLPDS